MDAHSAAQPLDFEDQFRRMVLSNRVPTPSNDRGQDRPNSRPPWQGINQHHYQQRQPSSPSQQGLEYNVPPQHGDHRGTTNLSGSGTFSPRQLPSQPQLLPPHRQSQKQRRMQQSQGNRAHGPPGAQYAPPPPPQGRQSQIDPNAFQRRGQVAGYYQQPQQGPRHLFNPNATHGPHPSMQPSHLEQSHKQSHYLEQIAAVELPSVTMTEAERDEKEDFRSSLEKVIHEVCEADPEHLPKVSLECFGSFKSGFANAGSDMDLVIVLQDGTPFTATFGLLEDDLPRALEKRLLQLGYGARLLTRTRVPIIKICEKPDGCLLDKLRQERERWEDLPVEKKYPHLHQDDDDEAAASGAGADVTGGGKAESVAAAPVVAVNDEFTVEATGTTIDRNTKGTALDEQVPRSNDDANVQNDTPAPTQQMNNKSEQATRPRRDQKPWTRERKVGPLDFPKSGIGIQSDINFFNPLGLHNTQMLRCYSLCDSRVQPMVLFIKSWVKQRKINSSYSGTLSSYGYVLMVLHYLVNVTRPPVLPNLQSPWRPAGQYTPASASRTECDGWEVDFWRNEDEIVKAVQSGQMSSNNEPLGALLAGFFHYYSSMGHGPQFHWMQEVLSLRSPGGIQSKEEKGWVKAVTEEGEGRKVQHRYLFCIEDPFELTHNVARTVTHMGIVAIRDEFRRARRILLSVGYGQPSKDGELFDALLEQEQPEVANEDGSAETASGKPTNLDDKSYALKRSNQALKHNQRQRTNGAKAGAPISKPVAKSPNVADQDSFPTLGAAKPKKGRSAKAVGEASANTSEISGDRARAYLDEVKRKKAEAAAEMTATGAAMSVLGDD